MPGYHSPTSDTSPGAPHQTEHSIASCFGCQNQTQTASDSDAPLFSYQTGESNSANSNSSLFPDESSASQLPSGLENAIDNYMRSVLRPEAFLTPGQPESHTSSPFWNSNIDPSLPPIGSSVSTDWLLKTSEYDLLIHSSEFPSTHSIILPVDCCSREFTKYAKYFSNSPSSLREPSSPRIPGHGLTIGCSVSIDFCPFDDWKPFSCYLSFILPRYISPSHASSLDMCLILWMEEGVNHAM